MPRDAARPPSPLRPLVLPVVALAAALLGALLSPLGRATPAAADGEPAKRAEMRYLSVVGEGATARAWYDGGPASGAPVQEALDVLAAQGYRVRHVVPPSNVVPNDTLRWAMLLERVK